MKKLFIYILTFLLLPSLSNAQFGFANMVEMTGVVMSSDSLRYLPYVSIEVEGENRGVVSSEKGVFSVIVEKGAKIKFSNLGFKSVSVQVPKNLDGIRYSIIQLMVQDTFYLPTTIIRPALTKAEFERAFVNWNIPMDKIEKSRRNTEMNTIRAMALTLPKDGGENTGYYQQLELQRRYWAGGQPPMNIFSPFAWSNFFKAWQRGDFKRKKK